MAPGVIVHYPPTFASVPETEPGLFLAGPIQGAPDWQTQAIKYISRTQSGNSLHIFNPRVPDADNPDEIKHGYEEQVVWEKHHLDMARELGAIIFWFAAKDDRLPYTAGRAYAQTSRIELGRVFGWCDYNDYVKVALGIEEGYIGSEKYFRTLADEYSLPVYTDLKDLCLHAVSIACNNR